MSVEAQPWVAAQARSVVTASRLLWLTVAFEVLGFGIGASWGRRWHATDPFEDFFSPPHLFIYSMHLCATITLAYLTVTPELRRHFGSAFRLAPFPFPVPGAIVLAGGGFVVTALAGAFDAVWHTAFGPDETAWSFPHSILGWGIFVAALGIVACRLRLAAERPIDVWTATVFGFVLLAAPAMVAGAAIADRVWAVVREPRRGPVLALVAVARIAVPALTGVLDVYLRTHTA